MQGKDSMLGKKSSMQRKGSVQLQPSVAQHLHMSMAAEEPGLTAGLLQTGTEP